MEGPAFEAEQFDCNLFHTDLVSFTWYSMHLMPNPIRNIDN